MYDLIFKFLNTTYYIENCFSSIVYKRYSNEQIKIDILFDDMCYFFNFLDNSFLRNLITDWIFMDYE